jgi:hypothetical protein
MPTFLSCHAIIGRPGRFYRAYEAIGDDVEIDQIFKRYEISEEEAAIERERERVIDASVTTNSQNPPARAAARSRRRRDRGRSL